LPRTLDPEGAHAAAVEALADLRGLRVLEIGCGEGRLTFRLAGQSRAWLATDPSSELIAAARAKTPPALGDRVVFAVAGGDDVDAGEAEFDLVFFSWSL
jgi:ubiquinone/menaquinone biosynthesis C-methylase UbiE